MSDSESTRRIVAFELPRLPCMNRAYHFCTVIPLRISARDLGEAVDRLAELPPDLLIIRPYINSMPGSMAADYLRTKQHGLPVLIVAGFLENDRTKVHNEISDFHTFPCSFTRREFLAKVDEVVESIRKRPA